MNRGFGLRACLPWLLAGLISAATAGAHADESTGRLSIAAVGDIMMGTEYPRDRLPPNDGADYFDSVHPTLSAADLAFGNLEGVLADGGEPGKKCSDPSACYRFRMPTRYAEHLARAGFDLLSLANNHARDFGEEGRTESMRTLIRTGINFSGRVGNYASLTHDGLRIALLSYAVTRNSNMLLDYRFAEQTIAQQAESHDIVIVTFHGGAEGTDHLHLPFDDEEYYGEPRGDVVRFARLAVDAGADLVLGHGPHVVRAMERYRDRLIAYSLGNFATHRGISIAGVKGVAPILIANLDARGRFLDGRIVSTRQHRPHGPVIDDAQEALSLIRTLSHEDFGNPGLEFRDDGTLVPVDRPQVERRRDFGADDDPGDGGPIPCGEDWYWFVESSLLARHEATIGKPIAGEAWKREIESRLSLPERPELSGDDDTPWCRWIDDSLQSRLR